MPRPPTVGIAVCSSISVEMEAYLRYEKAFERIVSGCPAVEWEDDEYDLDEV